MVTFLKGRRRNDESVVAVALLDGGDPETEGSAAWDHDLKDRARTGP